MVHKRIKKLFRAGSNKRSEESAADNNERVSPFRRRSSPTSNSIPTREEQTEEQNSSTRRPTIRTESEFTSTATEISGKAEQDKPAGVKTTSEKDAAGVNGPNQNHLRKLASNVSEADTARVSNISAANRDSESKKMNGVSDGEASGKEVAPVSAPSTADKMSKQKSRSAGKEMLHRDSSAPPPTEFSRYRSTGHKPLSKKVGLEKKEQIFDDPDIVKSYDSIPLLETTQLPRGGISLETQAVGRVQFGIPPETIKDSMVLGLGVPSVYVVPVERFCREMGPALGVNLAEFEFPAYFNFFVLKKKCTLIVDSDDAERNIRRVFSETLLGPAQFRREKDPITFEQEDFAPTFPREAIPDFQKEFKHFRIMPDGKELVLETLLKFCHFKMPGESGVHEGLGVPPQLKDEDSDEEACRSQRAASLILDVIAKSNSSPDLNKMPPVDEEKGPPANDLKKASTSCKMVKRYSDSGAKRFSESGIHSKDKRSSFVRTTDDLSRELGSAQIQSDAPDLHMVADEQENIEKKTTWAYSQAKWIGDVATVYPDGTTPEQIAAKSTKRIELFKMPGGTEYILHDIDENNIIVGKARFSGNVRVSESMSVDGFGGKSFMTELSVSRRRSDQLSDSEDEFDHGQEETAIPRPVLPPTFHPPSFGVTVLGNSHGFDKTGSVSGYVLWINGRGVMIDPPPYSSATLEREGIRPRTIVGIILTHCHADHDAGAFQKVLTGSPVVVITTPTIYKSFIRKYAALSALSPALLRHSHRHKPAIIGQPLRFQGATFHFTYTLHTIPCVGFRVEWRGRSMVFTGDHFNSPPAIDKLQETGVLSKGRADDLRNLPLQETDLLLHEAGAPPIHTPLDVLMALPAKVKKRLYVVHTSALPEGCELRVAPTGTAGTIRLDQLKSTPGGSDLRGPSTKRSSILENMTIDEDSVMQTLWNATSEYDSSIFEESSEPLQSSVVSRAGNSLSRMNSLYKVQRSEPPLVSLRPTSSTDAWFILNLLSAVPFLSSLSYSSTMEVLETARVDAFCINDIVVPASRRRDVLCVVWEGTCMERERTSEALANKGGPPHKEMNRSMEGRRVSTFQLNQGAHTPLTARDVKSRKRTGAVWHAGDWTGPRSLQPEKRLSGASSLSKTHDIVAMSSEGVKVITVEFSNLHAILKSGSALYRKYLARRAKLINPEKIPPAIGDDNVPNEMFETAARNLNIIELLECNSALRKLSAVQKRHLESLAEGPVFYNSGQRLWRSGAPVDKAFLIVAGTASFVPRRRNAGSVSIVGRANNSSRDLGNVDEEEDFVTSENERTSIGEAMRLDAIKAIQELGPKLNKNGDSGSCGSSISSADGSLSKDDKDHQFDSIFGDRQKAERASTPQHEVGRLSRSLQKRADSMNYPDEGKDRRDSHSSTTEVSHDASLLDSEHDSVHESDHLTGGIPELGVSGSDPRQMSVNSRRRRSSRDRFANKVLGRLYNRRAFTAGLVFSRGHFLGDVSKMVASLLTNAYDDTGISTDDASAKYGFGEKNEGKADIKSTGAPIGELVIHEKEGDQHVVHSSTLAAGRDGCLVLVFPQSSLIPFMDEYPGLLLSLLGTQVVV